MKILLDPRLQNDAVPAGTNTTSPHVRPLRARGGRRGAGEHRDPERSLSFWAAGLQGGLKVPGGRVADGRAVTQAFRSSHRARRARAGGSPGGPRICGKLSEPWLRLKVAGRISRQRASRPVPGSSGAGHRRLLWDCDSPRRHLPPARGRCLVPPPSSRPGWTFRRTCAPQRLPAPAVHRALTCDGDGVLPGAPLAGLRQRPASLRWLPRLSASRNPRDSGPCSGFAFGFREHWARLVSIQTTGTVSS